MNMSKFTPVNIASIAHEANRMLCRTHGDYSQVSWADAPEWQVKSALDGVHLYLNNPDTGPEASHESWMKFKADDGWVYGEVKDPAEKTHPCMVPFDSLPLEQQAKDHLFRAIMHALAHLIGK